MGNILSYKITMVEANKYTEEWATEKAGGEKYVNIACKGGQVYCPFEWLKFTQVAAEDEEGEKGGEEKAEAAPVVSGFIYDFITTEDADFENFDETGEHCFCPPPLKKKENGKHLEEMLCNDQKSKNDKEQGHWWTYISSMDDDLLLKVLSFANKLNCEALMRLCASRTCDRIYNCTVQEARDFLGFKCDY